MADLQCCPLDPHAMLASHTRMNLARVKEIEQHVSSAGPCSHPPLADLLFHGAQDGTFNGTSPLLLACEEGHLDAVERIVQVWHVDVNASATYYRLAGLTHSKIGEATPLFVAALKGHVDIVRYLLMKRANVSAITSTQLDNPEYGGLTPLHGALMENRPGLSFSDKRDESNIIVGLLLQAGANPSTLASNGTPIWMRDFCGADATIALVNHGLDLNQLNVRGETILYPWISSREVFTRGIIEKERMVVVQLLLAKGANLMIQDRKGFTPILVAAEREQYSILQELYKSDLIDRKEKIDALELAGALLLLRSGFSPDNSQLAYEHWKEALHLREEPNPINKIPLQKTSQWAVEWVSLEELQIVMRNPSVYWVQATVTRLRIYSYRSCKAVRDFIQSEFSFSFFKDSDDFYNVVDEVPTHTHIQDLLLEILGVFLLFGPYECPILWIQTEKLVRELTESLATSFLLSDVELERIAKSLQLILAVDPDGRLELQYDFFVMMAKLPDVHLHEDIRNYASPSARLQAGMLLDWACNRGDWRTLRLLLHLGAKPNSSYFGNWPLHIAASRGEDSCAHLLFDFGANPHAINKDGKTAVDLWMEKNCGVEGMQSIAWKNRPHWCRDTVPKLSCLAANTIHTHGIDYSEPGVVPVDCLPVLANH